MKNMDYKGYVVTEKDGEFTSSVQFLNTNDLPKNDVLIQIHYSSLNYKDALSATGNRGVTKHYPHTPGIDASGIVSFSKDKRFKSGDKVVVTGNDLGMNSPGGFGQYISVPADWVIKLPTNLSLKESMIYGTAGFTAGIQISRLIELVKPTDGKIIVSGATGGVGSIAISVLSKLGYQVTAISGKSGEYSYLERLGATEIINRSDFEYVDEKPLLTSKFAGSIDTVGGPILENIIKMLQPLGVVITCGSVASSKLNLTIFPFILRGISLIGVSSQNYPNQRRSKIWQKLSNDWKPDNLLEIYNEINLENIKKSIDEILKGNLKGRTIINLQN